MSRNLKVYIGFGSTWMTEPADIDWTDVSSEVMDRREPVTFNRGATSAFGEPETGQLNLTLRNADRRFDPLHTTGPYYGQLIPGVPIKVEASFDDELVWDSDSLLWDTDTLTWASGTASCWWGSIKSWPQRYDKGNTQATVPLTCFDAFDKLARAKIPRSVLEAEILGPSGDFVVGYWQLNETTGAKMMDSSGNAHHGTYVSGTTTLSASINDEAPTPAIVFDGEHYGEVSDGTAAAGTAVYEAVLDLSGVDLVDGDFHVILEQAKIPFSTGVQTRAMLGFEVIDADTRTVRFHTASYRSVSNYQITSPVHVSATGTLFTIDGVLDVGSLNVKTAANRRAGVSVGRTLLYDDFASTVGAVAHVVTFDDLDALDTVADRAAAALAPLDGQRVDERVDYILDQLGWPANLRSLRNSQEILGPATFLPGDNALDYLRSCAATEDAALFINAEGEVRLLDRYWRYTVTAATVPQLVFTDDGTGIGVSQFEMEPADDELLVNVARLTRRGGTEQVAVDEASTALYGEAELSISDLLHTNDARTRSQAEWIVVTRGLPVPRVPRVVVNLHGLDGLDQAALLDLELGHRVNCTRTPQGVGDPFSIDCVVAGIKHQVDAASWLVELYLSPAPDATVSLFTLGTSTLGGVDVLAY